MGARPFEPVLLGRFNRAVEGHPSHDFRKGKVARLATDLPDPLVRLFPDRLQIFKQVDLQAPGEGAGFESIAIGCMQCVHQLAIDIEL